MIGTVGEWLGTPERNWVHPVEIPPRVLGEWLGTPPRNWVHPVEIPPSPEFLGEGTIARQLADFFTANAKQQVMYAAAVAFFGAPPTVPGVELGPTGNVASRAVDLALSILGASHPAAASALKNVKAIIIFAAGIPAKIELTKQK